MRHHLALKLFVLLIGGAVVCGHLHAMDDLTPEQIETLAERCVVAIVREEVDLRKIAYDLQFDWPVTPPTYTFADHVERVMAQAKAAAEEKYPDSTIEAAKAEAEKRYSLLQVGDNAKLVSAKPPHRVYEGRIQAITDKYIRIGMTGNILIDDLDADTLARFSPDRSKERKAWFVKQAQEHLEINRQALIDELTPELLEKELLEDGYAPINKEKSKLKVYLAQDNWQNKSDILQEKALEWKKEMYEKRIGEARKNLYTSFDYEYDRMAGRWRRVSHVHDLPLNGGAMLNRSLLEKLQGK